LGDGVGAIRSPSIRRPATAAPLSQTLFAIITYPIHITGGTGKFAGATGDLTNIGEVDLGAKATVFRYSGQGLLRGAGLTRSREFASTCAFLRRAPETIAYWNVRSAALKG